MEDLKELRRLAEIVASHEPDFKDIHDYLEALRNMQGELSGTTVLSLLNRLEQAEQALDATERQVVARSGETAAERIWRGRAEQAEQAVARVREVAAEYRPSIPEEVLHEVMKDILRALDGDSNE